jgi:predicted metal-dependent peptidase
MLSAYSKFYTAIQRVIDSHPFHVGVINKCAIHEEPKIDTMAVKLRQKTIHLVYNQQFVMDNSLEALASVIIHEINHIVLGHLEIDFESLEYPEAMIIAMEVTANEFVPYPDHLPGEPILLKQYKLPEDETTWDRYNKLKDSGKYQKKIQKIGLALLESHAETLKETDQLSSLVFKTMAQDSLNELTPEQIKKVMKDFPFAKTIGSSTEGDELSIEVTQSQEKISWVKVLMKKFSKDFSPQPNFLRPNRRLPDLIGIVPGNKRRPTKTKLLAAIDTSMSMSEKDLSYIAGELKALSKFADIKVAEIDSEINRVYKFEGQVNKFQGRGGTCFRPIFRPEFLEEHQTNLVVYFTDGWGDAGEEPKGVETYWVLTENGVKPAKWGQIFGLYGQEIKDDFDFDIDDLF